MKRYSRLRLNIVLFILVIFGLNTQSQSYLQREDIWVNSIIDNMTLDQKIGQLFMVRAYSKGNVAEDNLIQKYIQKYHIGGLCFFQGSPEEQVVLINKFQKMSQTPMLMAIDAEWGLGMRFPDKAISFPKQMMLGAVHDNKLIYQMGREIAKQCKAVGIHLNFAPVVDININPNNPVIFDRSLGESPFHVTSKGYMYIKGMEDEGILACIKHFPGHGDTQVDSHFDLPIIPHDRKRLEEYEFFPFRRLASQGVGAIMVGHLHMPAIDNRKHMPASMSEKLVKNILREDIGYHGLIITDAMDMKAVTKNYPSGIAEAEAFLAGNDILLLPENLPDAFNAIKSYISTGKITLDRLNESVYRILRAKYKCGLDRIQEIPTFNLSTTINNNRALSIKQSIAESALTLVRDEKNLIPWSEIPIKTIATLSVNHYNKTPFQARIDDYMEAHHFQLMPNYLRAEYATRLNILSQYEDVVIAIHTSGKKGDFSAQIPKILVSFIEDLQKKTRVRVVLLGSPYLLAKLENIDHLVINYDNDPITQDATVQGLLGVFDIEGKLPFSGSQKFVAGEGISKKHLNRMGYGLPEMVNMTTDTLNNIDKLMDWGLKMGAFPGGQVVVAKNRRIIYQNAFGKLSESDGPTQTNTIYDIASITKILSTTLAAMKLVEDNKLDLDAPLQKYIHKIDTTNKLDVTIGALLTHNGRINPWLPFYKNTLLTSKSALINTQYYRRTLQDNFTIPVAKNMFLRDDYIDSMYSQIYTTPLRESNAYRYSDLGFYLLFKAIDNKANGGVENFVKEHFYKKLGLRFTGFNPFKSHNLSQIAPSEIDNYYRHQIIRGHVQDMGAAMMGGVAGHAGLFSTATEVTIMMQMLLNKGNYGGFQFLQPETVKSFTTRYFNSSRRGYGFDMKELDGLSKQNVSAYAPASIYGHTGYTGTCTWADPENDMIYTFISNRTYPSTKNQILHNKEIREKIQTVIYKSMNSLKGPNT